MSKKLKKSKYLKDSQLPKLILLADNKDFLANDKTPTRTDYVKKNREIDRSTLYNFNGTFQFLHADVRNLEFLDESYFLYDKSNLIKERYYCTK